MKYPPRPSLALSRAGLLLLLSTTAAAQKSVAGGHELTTPVGVIGTFTSIVSGDLDDNLSPELAVVRNGSLIVFHNPDANDDSVVVATGVLDVCYVPDVCGVGKPGLLYSSATTGLRIATFDDANNAYRTDPAASPAEATGAKVLRFGLDQGVPKIFFVSGTPQVFYSAQAVTGGFAFLDYLFPLTPTVRDFVLLDYADGATDLGLDLAVHHSNGFTIRSQLGTSWMSRAGLIDALAPVRCAGQSDALALVARLSGESVLILFHPGLYTPPPATYPYPTIVLPHFYSSVAAADMDADGRDDLALGQPGGFIDVLHDAEGPLYAGFPLPSFPGISWQVDMDGSGDPEFAMGKVLWANLFNDRDSSGNFLPSFAAALPASDVVRIVPGINARLGISSGGEDFGRVRFRSSYRDDTTPDCLSAAQAARWSTMLGGGWGATNANAIELIVRRHRTGASQVDNLGFHHKRFGLVVEGAVEGAVVDFLTTSLQDGGNPSGLEEDSAEKYFIQVRPIRVWPAPTSSTVDSPTVDAWRWSVLGMSASCPALESLRQLGAYLGNDVPICERVVCNALVLDCDEGVWSSECSISTWIGTRIIPSAVPLSKVPSSGPGVLPIIYPPDY